MKVRDIETTIETLGEFDKDEWHDIMRRAVRKVAPDWTDERFEEEFEKNWAIFQQEKKEGRLQPPH